MTTTDYLIDSALVLLVLLQIKERPLTTRQLLRPVIILGIAVSSYLHGIPTAGNDLVLAAAFVLIGGAIGVASGQTVIMRRGEAGEPLVRSGWISGFFWVLGMGSRMAFLVWIANGGSGDNRQLQRPPLDHQRRGVDGRAAGHGRRRGARPHRRCWHSAHGGSRIGYALVAA